MKVLFDGDIVAFRCAAAGEKEDFGITAYYMAQLVEDVMHAVGGDSYAMYLSGKNNFRYDVYPEYKANRSDQFIPRWREQAKQHLIEHFGGVVSEGCEADDLMGIAQCSAIEAKNYRPTGATGQMVPMEDHDTVIASLDKDLLMIPGNHYSWEISGTSSKGNRWTKPAIYRQVDHISGLRHFYTQCIMGDVADNMKGIVGRGAGFAAKLLDHLDTEQEMFDAVRDAYGLDEEFLMNARCLWIWQKPEDDFIKRFNVLCQTGSSPSSD